MSRNQIEAGKRTDHKSGLAKTNTRSQGEEVFYREIANLSTK